MKNKPIKAIELVIFEARPEFNQQEVKSSLELVNSILTSYKGFISRRLARNEDGQWMDLVLWESMEDAKAAADDIMKQKIAQEAFSVIDEQTMEFYHFAPHKLTIIPA